MTLAASNAAAADCTPCSRAAFRETYIGNYIIYDKGHLYRRKFLHKEIITEGNSYIRNIGNYYRRSSRPARGRPSGASIALLE